MTAVFLLLFLFSNSGLSFSLDRWLSNSDLGLDQVIKAWPLRLMQMQLCSIYLRAYYKKIQSPIWRSGHALPNAVMWPQWGQAWIRNFIKDPAIGGTMNFSVLFFQAAIPFLIWPIETRNYAIAAGLAMHLGMTFCLKLETFGPMMMCTYLLFI